MINFNGKIIESSMNSISTNRGFLFGDAVFETLKITDNKILFLEDHYFRFMASMRIMRMEIPMNFTMEYFENQILSLVQNLEIAKSARCRFSVYRNRGGFYSPETNEISFIIKAEKLTNKAYQQNSNSYEIELFKDFYVASNLLSTLKTNNKSINVLASIFAKENDFQNCLLINESKNIVEATNGNIFMVSGNSIITPPLFEGCLNGIMRKQIIRIIQKIDDYEIVEQPISPFDLQKADELFITNVISGIQPITKYRKKDFDTKFSAILLEKLNQLIQ
jgi:branched-chain amino acid aminotransferase